MLTLSAVRSSLWKYASSVAYSGATSDDKAAFDAVLNQVCERFLNAGYSDTQVASLTAYPDRYGNAFITLPRDLKSVIGVVNQTDDCIGPPLRVRSNWYEFLPQSGRLCPCDSGNAIALPGKFTTFQDWNSPMLLRVKLEQTEVAGTIIFRGKVDGDAIYSLDSATWIEGVKLSFTNATVTTSQYFDEPPYAVVKSTTKGRIFLYAVDADAVESLVAIYEPDETAPSYRRYKVPVAVTATIIGSNTSVPAVNVYSKADIDAMFGDSGTITVSAAGTHDLTVANAFFMRTIRVVAQAGSGAYTHKFTLDNSVVKTGAVFRVRLEIAASANPSLEFYDESTGGTLLQSIGGDSSNAQYVTFVFEYTGSAWVYLGSEV